jgi:hypothetical protein
MKPPAESDEQDEARAALEALIRSDRESRVRIVEGRERIAALLALLQQVRHSSEWSCMESEIQDAINGQLDGVQPNRRTS